MSQPDIFGASLVAVGSFNPPIISIDWLTGHNLIGKGDADAARNSDEFVAARQISRFTTDSLFVQVLENQLSMTCTSAVTPALTDLFCGVFELLPHTPVTAVGINFWAHYRLDVNSYHKIGDHFAPKALWNNIFPEKTIGLADLTLVVQDGTREKVENRLNQTRITLQPSGKFSPGVFMQYNGHFGGVQNDEPIGYGRAALIVVRDNWERCHADSLRIFDETLKAAKS